MKFEDGKKLYLMATLIVLILAGGVWGIICLHPEMTEFSNYEALVGEDLSRGLPLNNFKDIMLDAGISYRDYCCISEVMKLHVADGLLIKDVDIIDCHRDSQERKWEIFEECYNCWRSGSPDPDGCYFIKKEGVFLAHPIAQLKGQLPKYLIIVREALFLVSKDNPTVTETGLSVAIWMF